MSEILNIIKETFLNNPISKSDFDQVNECNEKGNILLHQNSINTLQEKFEGFSVTDFNTLLLLEYNEEDKHEGTWHQSFSFFTEEGLYTLRRKNIKEGDGYIYYHDHDLVGFKKWINIKNIVLFEEDGYFRLRFYFYSTDDTIAIISKRFGTITEKGIELIKILLDEIVSFANTLEENIIKNIENKNFKEVLHLLDLYAIQYDINDIELRYIDFYYQIKAMALEGLGELKKALLELDTLIKLNQEAGFKSPEPFELKAKFMYEQGELIKAMNYIAYSEENIKETKDKNSTY